MDPRWLPWCWGAGAIGCGVVFFLIQPWRVQWRNGWNLMRRYPKAWLLAAGLAMADIPGSWAHGSPVGGDTGIEEEIVAVSVRQALQGWTLGAGAGLVVAGMLLFNVGGIRRGMIKGVESVTGKRGRVWLGVLFAGALALAADLLLQGKDMPALWTMVVTLVAVPLTGWVSAAVLAGWLLLAETDGRMPAKIPGVRWLETSAAHAARLWPWILLHGLGWWLVRWLPHEAVYYSAWALTVGAVGFGFAPLIFLHVKQLPGTMQGIRGALQLWKGSAWQPLVWLMGAGVLFYAWSAVRLVLASAAAGAPDGVKVVLAALGGLGQICLTFLSLGAWVAFRLADVSPSPQRKSSRKAKSS
jgi:hypothetical protein